MSLQTKDIELFPSTDIVFTDKVFVIILIVIDAIISRNLNLCIRTRKKVHVFSLRKSNLEFLDKTGNIFVGKYRTLPLLNTENRLRYFNFKITFYLCLTSQTPMVLDLFTGEMRSFTVQNFTTTFKNLYFTLSTTGLTAT